MNVTLYNSGATVANFSSFSFELQADNPALTFTGATIPASNYIFTSANSSDLAWSLPLNITSGSTLLAADLALNPISLAADSTVSLGQVSFDVTSGPMTINVSFADVGGGTSLAGSNPDDTSFDIHIDQANSGTIESGGAVTPEPPILVDLGGLACVAVIGGLRLRRKRAHPIGTTGIPASLP